MSFFAWVKDDNVPSFNPNCIVTDGATYINHAYVESTGNKPLHIVCWWHKFKTAKGRKGYQRYLKQRALGVVYGENVDLLENRYEDFEAQHWNGKKWNVDKKKYYLMNILEEMADNALINLQVFTGGTITNSYAESVNNQIRRYQLAFHLNSKDKIPILRHFCKYQVKPLRNSFVPKQDLINDYAARCFEFNLSWCT